MRKFSSKAPDWRDIIEAIDAARFAPMAGGNYSPKFILVSDQGKIQKIAEACQQPYVGTAHYIVVVCSTPNRTINSYGERGQMYVRQQAGAAIENFFLKIVEKKLATCWVGHFVDSMIKETLRIPEEVQLEAIFPIGYEYEKPRTKKQKIEIDSILYFDEYGNKKMNKIRKIDA